MPELPEVETTLRGILARLRDRTVATVVVRETRLRWPIPAEFSAHIQGQAITDIQRRGKYLLFRFPRGTLLVHFGMSGSLRFAAEADDPPKKHDHIDLVMGNGQILRYHDPRRFGGFLWIGSDPLKHESLRRLGQEPLDAQFHGDDLYHRSRGKRLSVKKFIMDGDAVVGVGNIYANEALYRAGISPARQAGRVGLARYRALAESVREVLQEAIDKGGTTLRDYMNSSGDAGQFQIELFVYGRAGEPCRKCGRLITLSRVGRRSTFFCRDCQR